MNSYWIWNYGDYEIFHSNLLHCRREDMGSACPPGWKMYDIERNVHIHGEKDVAQDGFMILHLNGVGNITVDGKRYPSDTEIEITKGHHDFFITLCNPTGLPSAFIESDVVGTDGEWYTKDHSGKKTPVGFEPVYNTKDSNPEVFHFSYQQMDYVDKKSVDGGTLFDFGKELFGFLYLSGVAASDRIRVNYGESAEEALDLEESLVREDIFGKDAYQLRQRAFRYVFVKGCAEPEVYAELEYLPLPVKGSFECNETAVNDIWTACAYTLQLTAREILVEGIKRDHYLWCGDAYQAFKFTNALFFDKELVRRTLIAMRGKDPVYEHLNTITDYSLYWVIGLWEYYQTYQDADFIRFIYPRAVSLMAFCLNRTDEHGFIIGKEEDWLFIDWADALDKSGVVCAEQMLLVPALLSMYELSKVVGENGTEYQKQADALKTQINKFFWNDDLGAFIDNFQSEDPRVNRHANIFAIMYHIATEEQQRKIEKNVLLNPAIPQITTPYFEGYELDAMGMVGNRDYIYDMLHSYWKGMLDLGATTIWEEYNPELSGVEHYAMYGDKFRKSLCHAWGASPVYLLSKYFLGVEAVSVGYETFTVTPYLGKFAYIKGTVPIQNGEVAVYLSKDRLSVKATRSGGTLIWNGAEYPLVPNEEFTLQF